MKIRTEYVFPPIPDRSSDWSAVDDDTYDGPGSPIGYGRTEMDAVQDLVQQIEDRYEARIERYERRIESLCQCESEEDV